MSLADILQTPGIPIKENEPVFSAPWQAKAFAIVVQLADKGAFEWKDWVDQFSAEVAKAEQHNYQPETDYYPCWVRALENLLATNKVMDSAALNNAVDNTLANWPHPDHIAHTEPVHISPALK